MADDAVLDTGAEEVLDQSTDTGLETDSQAVDTSTETEAPAIDDGVEPTSSQLWKSIKEPLKGLDKKTSDAVRKALFTSSELQKAAPEGLRKLTETVAAVRQLADDPDTADAEPVETLIANTLAERTFWRDFDNDFQTGNPKLIEQMVSANAESFQKLIPEAMNKFAELNPDGYSSLVANATLSFMDSAKLPLQFEILEMLLPKTSDDPAMLRVIGAFGAIKQTIDALRQFASKPVNSIPGKQQQTEAGTDREASLADREMRLRDVEWNVEVKSSDYTFMGQEAVKAAGKNKFTADEQKKIQNFVKEEINARVGRNPEYQKALKSYLKANNKTAYTQRVVSEHRKIIPNAVRRAIDDVLARRGTAKQPVAPKTNQGPQKAASQAPQTGFERIAGAPQTQGLKIDHRRTSSSMLVKGQAYVQGRKNPVTWALR